jgi:hypothetical protein
LPEKITPVCNLADAANVLRLSLVKLSKSTNWMNARDGVLA